MRKIIPICLILIACSGNQEPYLNGEDQDTTSMTIVSEEPDEVHIDQDDPSILSVNSKLKNLLDNPINLVQYKKDYGTSNSGSAGNKEFFETPDTVGMMFRYMLFHKLRMEIPSHPSEGDLFNGFIITVYRYGERVGNFYDTNEELMMIECSLDNPTLGELNWYGLSKRELVDNYDSAQYEVGDNWIYEHENKVISAHFSKDNKVDWFKYAKINRKIDLRDEIPEILTIF
jgi:hypothetical protein